ncbi:MAG: hypothetical protein KKF30_16645 [Proteobacteria bacterium]|nr:hypothetical protein [Pseudomonadota bacterium]MBU4469568.1 hypothetical protein [Pseudomonadota bacterium]MCG2753246.1 hypothetical protein [Desulfobacteraceae bacterium]
MVQFEEKAGQVFQGSREFGKGIQFKIKENDNDENSAYSGEDFPMGKPGQIKNWQVIKIIKKFIINRHIENDKQKAWIQTKRGGG